MWSSKEVLLISIATGFVFCFATIYTQNAMTKYVNRQVEEKTGGNPLIGMGLAQRPERQEQLYQDQSSYTKTQKFVRKAPSGSGSRWTPLPI